MERTMAGKTYRTKGYSSYTNIPARQGDLDYGQKTPVGPYDFETKTKKQTPIPTLGYNFSGSPTKFELLKEYVYAPNMATGSIYAPMNHYQGYVPNYGVNHENSTPYMKPNYASSPNEHLFSRPVHGYPSEESHGIHSGHGLARASPSLVRTQNFPSPVRTQNIPTPDKMGQSGGPPTRPNPLTTLPNNIGDDTLARPPPTKPHPLTTFNDVSDDAATRPLYTRLPLLAKPNNIGHNFTNT